MDPMLDQDHNLGVLVDILKLNSGYNGFRCNSTPDGAKLTVRTFYQVKNLTAEYIKTVIVILMTHFGYLDLTESKNGKLKPKFEVFPHSEGISPSEMPNRMVDVTADYLDSKILQIFFPKSMEKEINPSTHYDYFILVCPELDPKKVRAALSYFTYFCVTTAALVKHQKSLSRTMQKTIKSVSEASELIDDILELQEVTNKLEQEQTEYESHNRVDGCPEPDSTTENTISSSSSGTYSEQNLLNSTIVSSAAGHLSGLAFSTSLFEYGSNIALNQSHNNRSGNNDLE